jgi:hypothetical protein
MKHDAIALFAERARVAKRRFVLTDENVSLVSDIVRQLEGIPLAIELSAAQLKTVNLRELRTFVDERVTMLGDGEKSAQRHQTLETLIAWSHSLLDDDERTLLRRLSVFRGSWTLEAAEALYDESERAGTDVHDLLASLVNKSLVVADTAGAATRYRLFDTTRAFALERLSAEGERTVVAARHCRYFSGLAQRDDERYWSSSIDDWVSKVSPNVENYRSAISWALTDGRDPLAAATIVAGLRVWWNRSGRIEGGRITQRVLGAIGSTAPTLLRARLTLAEVLLTTGPSEDALRQAVSAFIDVGDRSAQVEAMWHLTRAVGLNGRLAEAAKLHEETEAAARSLRKPRQLSMVLMQAYWFALVGEEARARASFDEALTIVRVGDDREGLALTQINRGELSFQNGDIAGALVCAREAEEIFRERRYEAGLLVVLGNLAAYNLAAAATDKAWDYAQAALDLAVARDDASQMRCALGHLASVSAENADPIRAALILGYVDAALELDRQVREPTEQSGYDRTLEIIRQTLTDSSLLELMATGASMDQREIVGEAKNAPKPPTRTERQ